MIEKDAKFSNKNKMNYTTEFIWTACRAKITDFVKIRVSNNYHVEELVQEIFIKIHKNIDKLKDNTKLSSWVFTICRNTVIDYYRKNKPHFEPIDDFDIDEESNSDSLVDKDERNLNDEIVSALQPMIGSLPEIYAQAIDLVELKGVSQVDLAQKLNISVSGAKSRVQRARQMIKESLMNCCHYEFDKYGTVIGVKPKCCCCCNKL